jgi:DNA-binding transcriptional ArsR family regulator
MLRGKFIAISAYIKKNKDLSNKQPNVMMHLKLLEKQEQTKLKTSKQSNNEYQAEINEIKTKQTTQRISETRSWFLKRLARSTIP